MIAAAFYIWPLIAWVLFHKLTLPVAIISTILGGYLFLPTQGGFDLPAVMLDKDGLPAAVALVLAAVFARSYKGPAQPGWFPRSAIIVALLILLTSSHFGTWITNRDPSFNGNRILQGLGPMDALASMMRSILMIVPFLLARKFLATREGHRTLLIAIVAWMAGYGLLALYEVRMSPQLNLSVYGYFPHDWAQHFRAGGFRPVVFMSHGLVLGIMLACATIAAFGLWKSDTSSRRTLYLCVAIYLLGTLYLSKTVGALAITLVLLPILLFLPTRLQALLAGVIVVTVLLLPMLRSSGFIPTQAMVQMVEPYSRDRAASLRFRFNQEDTLLAKAKERPLFGWGGYGRSRVFSADGGRDSVADGRWVISIGLGGWSRYIAEMGLASIAVLVLALRWRRYSIDRETAALALVLAANLIDLIPNSGLTPLTWLVAGALAGRLELRQATPEAEAQATAAASSDARPPGLMPAGAQPIAYRRPIGRGAAVIETEGWQGTGPRLSRFAPRRRDPE